MTNEPKKLSELERHNTTVMMRKERYGQKAIDERIQQKEVILNTGHGHFIQKKGVRKSPPVKPTVVNYGPVPPEKARVSLDERFIDEYLPAEMAKHFKRDPKPEQEFVTIEIRVPLNSIEFNSNLNVMRDEDGFDFDIDEECVDVQGLGYKITGLYDEHRVLEQKAIDEYKSAASGYCE